MIALKLALDYLLQVLCEQKENKAGYDVCWSGMNAWIGTLDVIWQVRNAVCELDSQLRPKSSCSAVTREVVKSGKFLTPPDETAHSGKHDLQEWYINEVTLKTEATEIRIA